MKINYNHSKNPVGAIGRIWKDEKIGLVFNQLNERGKLVFINPKFLHYVDEFGLYEFKGRLELTKNGLFYKFTPSPIFKINGKEVSVKDKKPCEMPSEYVYGGKIRLFFTDGTSELLVASCVSEALKITKKAHLYDFYQSE